MVCELRVLSGGLQAPDLPGFPSLPYLGQIIPRFDVRGSGVDRSFLQVGVAMIVGSSTPAATASMQETCRRLLGHALAPSMSASAIDLAIFLWAVACDYC